MLNWFKKKEASKIESSKPEVKSITLTIFYFNENIQLGKVYRRYVLGESCKVGEEFKLCRLKYKQANLKFLEDLKNEQSEFVNFDGRLIIRKGDFISSEIEVK